MATAAHHTTDSYTDEIEELFDYRVIEQPATTSGHHSMIIGYGNQAFADHWGELVKGNITESLGRAAHTRIVDGALMRSRSRPSCRRSPSMMSSSRFSSGVIVSLSAHGTRFSLMAVPHKRGCAMSQLRRPCETRNHPQSGIRRTTPASGGMNFLGVVPMRVDHT